MSAKTQPGIFSFFCQRYHTFVSNFGTYFWYHLICTDLYPYLGTVSEQTEHAIFSVIFSVAPISFLILNYSRFFSACSSYEHFCSVFCFSKTFQYLLHHVQSTISSLWAINLDVKFVRGLVCTYLTIFILLISTLQQIFHRVLWNWHDRLFLGVSSPFLDSLL